MTKTLELSEKNRTFTGRDLLKTYHCELGLILLYAQRFSFVHRHREYIIPHQNIMLKPTLIDFLAVVRSKKASGFFLFWGGKASLNVAPKLPKHCKTPPRIMNERRKFCSFKKDKKPRLFVIICVRKYQKTKFIEWVRLSVDSHSWNKL